MKSIDMEEAQELCDEIAFIMDGNIIMQGTYEQLQSSFQDVHTYELELMRAPVDLLPQLELQPEFKGHSILENGHTLLTFDIPKTAEGEASYSDFVNKLSPYSICQLIRKKMDLRSMYLQFVNSPKQKTEQVKATVSA